MKNYRIYARLQGQSNFKPMDWNAGQQVTNLIYATIIPESNLQLAKDAVDRAFIMNEGIELQIRDIENNKLIHRTH